MILVVLALLLRYHVTSQTISGLYKVTQGTRLTGIMQRQRVNEIMTCAHFCTMDPRCNWFNFKPPDKRENGLCELIRRFDSRELVQSSLAWAFYQLIEQPSVVPSSPSFSATFTNLDGRLYTGPASTNGYKGTPLDGNVTLQKGIQLWNVPYTGWYSIEAFGASGGNGTNSSIGAEWRLGGRGARIKGNFQLKAGIQLKILVGQKGGIVNQLPQRPGGGGGGTFVTTSENTILVIAGGGGGGASIAIHCDCKHGDPGQSNENGTRHGGSSGNGGKRYDKKAGYSPSRKLEGSAGGGFYTDGSSTMMTGGGKSFISGGGGGQSRTGAASGGFGGGGAATSHPGGGGGYSGGGVVGDGASFAVAGGGGSFNAATEQVNESGVNRGHGKVVIQLIK